MNLQDKIIERYKLISEKMDFLETVSSKEGFSNCREFLVVRKDKKRYSDETIAKWGQFLKMIETQISFDEKVKEIKVQNYKIISDSNFS